MVSFVRVNSSLSKYSKKWSYCTTRDGRVEAVGHSNHGRLQLGLVVKEQGVLRQMLVCYESILTGESRAVAGGVIGAFI